MSNRSEFGSSGATVGADQQQKIFKVGVSHPISPDWLHVVTRFPARRWPSTVDVATAGDARGRVQAKMQVTLVFRSSPFCSPPARALHGVHSAEAADSGGYSRGVPLLRRLESVSGRRPPCALRGGRALLYPVEDHRYALANQHAPQGRVRRANGGVTVRPSRRRPVSVQVLARPPVRSGAGLQGHGRDDRKARNERQDEPRDGVGFGQTGVRAPRLDAGSISPSASITKTKVITPMQVKTAFTVGVKPNLVWSQTYTGRVC